MYVCIKWVCNVYVRFKLVYVKMHFYCYDEVLVLNLRMSNLCDFKFIREDNIILIYVIYLSDSCSQQVKMYHANDMVN